MPGAIRKMIAVIVLCVTVTLAVRLQATATQQQLSSPLAAADAAMQAGRFADAARGYEVWLKTNPDSDEVLLALGVCYVQLKKQSAAATTLRRYLKINPQSAAGHAALGVALLDGSNTVEAKAELETAVRLDAKQADAVEALARIYLIENQAERAVALLKPLMTRAATDDVRILLGDALIKSGQAAAAARLLEGELQLNPRGPSKLYAAAAWAHLKAGDQLKAAEISERGMRIYPDAEIEAVYLTLPAQLLAARIGARIRQLQNEPEVSELIAVGRALIGADPDRKTRANEIAQQLLTHAARLAPDNASARYNLGRALSRNSIESALTEWDKALTLRPDQELRLQILNKVGTAKLDLADYAGAEKAYREALEIDRKLADRRPETMLNYLRFLQLRSRADEAETLLDEMLSWNPLSPQTHLERAKLFAARGRWEDVIEAGGFVLRNAGEEEELLRAAHVLLARAHINLKQPDKARPHRAWLESH